MRGQIAGTCAILIPRGGSRPGKRDAYTLHNASRKLLPTLHAVVLCCLERDSLADDGSVDIV